MKFSIPSLDQIIKTGSDTFTRFPMVILSGISFSIYAITLVEISPDDPYQLYNFTFLSLLGISLFFAADSYAYASGWNSLKIWLLRSGVLLFLIIYGWQLSYHLIEGPAIHWFRFILYALAAHLLVSFAPFIHSKNVAGFWEYNKTLFLRILISALYSGVLYIGLVIAFLALRYLLEIEIDEERFLQLFFVMLGVFNTWFFLSGVPVVSAEKELKPEFPKGLKVFVQYVLIPLVTVYIVILYSYLIKIMLQWELPNGWVSNLVLSFSIAGILSLLLLYPIRESEENRWVRIYSRYYYLALIPLIGLLMFSIGTRISEYGVTVNRYFVATLGVWLTGIVLYNIISKRKDIRVIPMSLFVLTVLVSFGPMGAFSVSERSQTGRFEQLLTEQNILNGDGVVSKISDEISFSDRKEISSITHYLFEIHGLKSVQEFYTEHLITNEEAEEGVNGLLVKNSDELVEKMGFDFVHEWQSEPSAVDNSRFSYSLGREEYVTDIKGYDYDLGELRFSSGLELIRVEDEINSWILEYDYDNLVLTIEEEKSQKSIDLSLAEMLNKIEGKMINDNGTPRIQEVSVMILTGENEDLRVKAVFSYLAGNKNEEMVLVPVNINFQLYLTVR